MLRACRRILKPGARIASLVVGVADGLSPRDVGRAIAAGPPYVDAGPGYAALLEAAGFVDIEIDDLTDDYAATLSASIRSRDDHRARLEELLGPGRFTEGQTNRRLELTAIHDGLLQRHLISAVRP